MGLDWRPTVTAEALPLPRLLPTPQPATQTEAPLARLVERINANDVGRPRWKVGRGLGLIAATGLALVFAFRPEPDAKLSRPPLAEAPARPAARVSMASGLERVGGHREVMHVGAPLAAGDVVATTKGGRALVTLPDESIARLGGATELRLNRLEANDVALELEHGQVFIRASHVDSRGFVVSAGGLSVYVVGTVFEVANTKGLTEVAVSEGKVRVELPDGEREVVSAGQRLTIDALGRLSRANELTSALRRAFDEVAGVGDPDRPLASLPTVAPAIGGVRSAPPLVTAPPRTLPRLDPRQARARQGRLPAEALAGEPVVERQAPVAEAPVTQRLEPPTELVVEPPGTSAASAPEPLVDTQWALPPTATVERAPRPTGARVPEPGAVRSFGGSQPDRQVGDPSEWSSPPPSDVAPVASPAVVRRGTPVGAPRANRPPGQDLESLFIGRAEVALEHGGCGRFLVGLEDIAQDDTRSPKSEHARVLRARCFDLELRPRQASNEYRKYLEEYPRGRHVLEAKEALGAQ